MSKADITNAEVTIRNVFTNPCAICRKRESTQLCDYIIQYDNGIIFYRDRQSFNKFNAPGAKHETCDLPLCKECSKVAGEKVDMCPHHYNLHMQADLPERLRRAQLRSKGELLGRTWK